MVSAAPEKDLVAVFRGAVQGLSGGLLVWVLTCTLAGAVATAAAEGVEEVDWLWALVHWPSPSHPGKQTE